MVPPAAVVVSYGSYTPPAAGAGGGDAGGGTVSPPATSNQEYSSNPNIDLADVTAYAEAEALHQDGTIYVNGVTFDNTLPNDIDTRLSGFDGQAGLGDDYIIGGAGGYTGDTQIDGGAGFDYFIATTAPRETGVNSDNIVRDRNGGLVDVCGF